ncbi:MAG TPA: DUF2521 family protein [Bacillales bacterium]|nr:DUF2521 family protein [Bacillales bacterium]
MRLNVITSFTEKQRHKQVEFERKVLRDLSFTEIEKTVELTFSPYLKTTSGYQSPLEEVCVDYAVEAFLLGASYSRLGYYGEPIEQVEKKSREAKKKLTDDLYDYWTYWSHADELMLESIYTASELYVDQWWRNGFETGEKRYRLRLH